MNDGYVFVDRPKKKHKGSGTIVAALLETLINDQAAVFPLNGRPANVVRAGIASSGIRTGHCVRTRMSEDKLALLAWLERRDKEPLA